MLPNLPTDEKKDYEALSQAMKEALKPLVEEIEQKIKEVRAEAPELSDKQFTPMALEFTVDRLREAIEEMTSEIKESVSDKDVYELMEGFSKKSADQQMKILHQILKNEEVQRTIEKDFMGDMIKNLDRLVEIGVDENKMTRDQLAEYKRIEAERDRKLTRESARRTQGRVKVEQKVDDSGVLDKLVDLLDKNSFGGLFFGISQFMKDMGLLIGAGGLVSMIPKKVREFIDDYLGAFTTIKALLNSSWLKPLMRIIEHMPIIGAIAKKLPGLAWIFAAFDVLPKVFEKYKTEGWWGALEEGLKGLSKFFITDVVGLVGKLADYVEKEVFGVDLFDFEGVGESLKKTIDDTVDTWIESVKQLIAGDFKGAGKRMFAGMLKSVDNVVNMVLKLFKLPGDWDTAAQAKKLWDGIGAAVDAAVEFVKLKINAGIEGFSGLVDSGADVVGDVWDMIVDKITTAFSEALDSLTDLKDTMSKWFSDVVDDFKNKFLSTLGIGPAQAMTPLEQSSLSGPIKVDPVATQGLNEKSLYLHKKTVVESSYREMEKMTRPTLVAPSTNISNRSSTSVTNYSTGGMRQANPKSPLSVSVGQ